MVVGVCWMAGGGDCLAIVWLKFCGFSGFFYLGEIFVKSIPVVVEVSS